MATGYFIVSQDGTSLDIVYQIDPAATGACPDDQLALKNDLEAAEAALKVLYPDENLRVPRFRELLSLAQVGLQGANAEPKIAASALANLKQAILVTEGGARKNRYLKTLGKWAAIFATLPLGLAIVLRYILPCFSVSFACDKLPVSLLINFSLLWAGAMIGAWLSYGLRTEVLTFEELTTPEEDRLEPGVRLLFVGVLALVVGLALYIGVLEISFGKISSHDFMHRSALALLIGILMGASERALSGQVTKLVGNLLPGK
jgi:hypothetical protein